VGLTLVAFGRDWRWRLAGAALAAIPQVAGAPGPGWEGLPPSGMHFAFGALAATLAFWLTLGAVTGSALDRAQAA
jgi:predicted cobalt transporter CbtA